MRISARRVKTRQISSGTLRRTASFMLPFYRRAATNSTYNSRFSTAVRQANLTRMETLLYQATGRSSTVSMSATSIGYYVDLWTPSTDQVYSNGTTIGDGVDQFRFSAPVHRRIAAAVIPLYNAIANNQSFRISLAQAINANNTARVRTLVRSRVTTTNLRTIKIAYSGISLGFRYPSLSTYTYYNELFLNP